MLGYDHESFWDQTPRTLSLTFEAYNNRQAREHNQRAWLAWHTAVLSRQKKLDPLSKLLVQKQSRTPMEEQIEGLKRWALATGGRVIYAKDTKNG